MRRGIAVSLAGAMGIGLVTADVRAVVFISEVFINPPGSFDSTQEFIELMGTPGMKLDGYAVANVNGALTKYYPLGSIPPIPFAVAQEIDELISLDGLTLGQNGILVVGVGFPFHYETLLPDSNFDNWLDNWNGVNGSNPPSQLSNDGSTTVVLLRRRPGRTQADDANPGGLRWGKDVLPDGEVITPVMNPQTSQPADQLGDGNIDRGDPDNIGGFTLDLKGVSTPSDDDDLEVVDEVSFESDQGWEYDFDGRRVDVGSTSTKLRERRVHAIGDPQGFNPDCITRVDYRTKGPGWPPFSGTGQLPNGNNWQDTAAEQWIRGDTVVGGTGSGGFPLIYFDIGANTNPDAVQPYRTHVPQWLANGSAPDFNFTTPNSVPVAAGRVNPYAIPFIPGDVDRDGDCDADDIAKLAAVFGDDDWIFSNSFSTSTYGDSNDPASQTRPWDVDCTGANGIEASDLQWVLNFQGNTNGRIIGRTYDSLSPSATGIALNPNSGTNCTVTASAASPCGRPINALFIGDVVHVTVSGRVTAGANGTPGQENGIMQYVHDAVLSAGGVLRVQGVQPLGVFHTTRASLQSLQGVSGDLGMTGVNGYATSFTQGVTGAVNLYRITLKAVAAGSASIAISPAAMAKFAASTPNGLKIGHTDQNGNPAAATYPAAIALTVTSIRAGDVNGDSAVNALDAPVLASVLTGVNQTPAHVAASDINCDGARNGLDVQAFVDLLLAP
jgi:hypothetical protein